MKILADESVDYGIVKFLRERNFVVISVMEDYSGISDKDVLKLANQLDALLLTEDKDFGELTYRLQYKHKGIFLIRLTDMPRKDRIKSIAKVILERWQELSGNFSVLTKQGLRVKKGFLRK